MAHDNPPPGPGWTLGPDGHWRPPSLFDTPAPPTAPPGPPPPGMAPPTGMGPPSAWNPPPGTVPPPTGMGPPSAWNPAPGPMPGPAPGAWPPPAPAAGGSGARTVLLVLGGVGLGGLGLVVVLIMAVTFLGTSSRETSSGQFTPIDTTPLPGSGGTSGLGTEPEEGGEVTPPSEALAAVAAASADQRLINLGWDADRHVTDAGDQDRVELCTSDPTGASRLELGTFQDPEVSRPEGWALRYQITEYDTAEQADAALARITSAEWRACALDDLQTVLPDGMSASYHLLPPDPLAPGVAYRIDLTGRSGSLAPTDRHIVVGRLRAYVDDCGCDPEAAHLAAQQVAAALAEAQDLPAPG